MLDAHYLWVCHLSIHIWFNHNWALKLRNQYHVDGRTQNQICSKPSLLYFVVVQGLIYSTAKPGQWALQYKFYGVPSNSMVGQEKKGEASKKGTKLRFTQELQLKLIKLLKFKYSKKAKKILKYHPIWIWQTWILAQFVIIVGAVYLCSLSYSKCFVQKQLKGGNSNLSNPKLSGWFEIEIFWPYQNRWNLIVLIF